MGDLAVLVKIEFQWLGGNLIVVEWVAVLGFASCLFQSGYLVGVWILKARIKMQE